MSELQNSPVKELQKEIFKKKVRNDILLLSVILVVALIFLGIFLLTRKAGDTVVVSINGAVYASYPISSNRTVELPTGADGSHKNVLVIEDGKAYVSSADCRDGICVNHNPISEVGETIICLPNRLVIEIEGEN